jgi:hypothetical protein
LAVLVEPLLIVRRVLREQIGNINRRTSVDLDQCATIDLPAAFFTMRREEESMPAFSSSTQTKRWCVLSAFAQAWRQWSGIRAAELLEVARLGVGDLEYLTHDVGFAGFDLRQPVRRGPNEANLLARRMAALDLDPYELAIGEPALVGHLQRRCMLCESWPRCLQDLARNPIGSAWRDRQEWLEYCPNASTLEMLSALQSCTKTTPKYSFPYLG